METKLFVNNDFVGSESGETFAVSNPATEDEVVKVSSAGAADVDKAVAAAEQAFSAWRAASFSKLADLLDQHNDDLSRLEAVCMGRPVSTYSESRHAVPDLPIVLCNIWRCLTFSSSWGAWRARFIRYMAGKATDLQGKSSTHTQRFLNIPIRQPYGVCAAITPWNAPVTMLAFSLGSALVAGNTLVVNSSEKAPLTGLLIGKIME